MLNYEYPPLGGGAANQTAFTLQNFYNNPEIGIDLITSSTGKYKVEMPAANVRIFYLDIQKNEQLHYQSYFDLLRYSWASYFFIKKLMRQNNYAGIHAFFGIPCGFIAWLSGLHYGVSLCGSDVPFHNKRYKWLDILLFKHLSKIIWRKAKFVVPNSTGLMETACKTLKNYPFEIIPNGVDCTVFQPKKEHKNNTNELKIIAVGRLSKIKQFNILIEALAGLENCSLQLIGDGPELFDLKKIAEEKKVHCTFSGKLNRTELIAALQNSDLFVLPSENEGMSNALLEAMACGLPVIVSNVGGSAELVDNNGFIIEAIDSEKIRQTLILYSESNLLLKEHGINSRKKALEMSWLKVANRYLNLYKKFLI